jgi:hypothetical protein
MELFCVEAMGNTIQRFNYYSFRHTFLSNTSLKVSYVISLKLYLRHFSVAHMAMAFVEYLLVPFHFWYIAMKKKRINCWDLSSTIPSNFMASFKREGRAVVRAFSLFIKKKSNLSGEKCNLHY